MDPLAEALITFGVVLLVGLATDAVGHRVGVPRVTLLVLVGVAVGPDALDVLPERGTDWFPVVSTIALTMIGFLLGQSFTVEHLRTRGPAEAALATIQGLTTAAVVTGGLVAAGVGTTTALLLGGIAIATAPAATLAVIGEKGAAGPFSRMLVAVVALDDVVAITLFGFLVAGATIVEGEGAATDLLAEAGWEIGGAVLIGGALGVPVAILTGRLRPGEPTREEAYGAVLVCAGLALWADVSFLLAAVVLGAVVANAARHHDRPFREIERIEWPFLVVFFVLAGASLDLGALDETGWLAAGYVGLRLAGKVAGCTAGSLTTDLGVRRGAWLGWAMLPQAGVALGLALLGAETFPDVADDVIGSVLVATVVFELAGPLATSVALDRVGESGRTRSATDDRD